MAADSTAGEGRRRDAIAPLRDEATAAGGAPRRALVALAPAPATSPQRPRSRLADALFVAHMFATKFKAPQTREKRRADPADADAFYRKAAKRPAPMPGRIVSRKI